MKHICRTLVATREIYSEFAGETFKVEYFLTEKDSESENCAGNGKIYGVSMSKKAEEEAEADDIFETFLTQDKKQADMIINKLAGGFVTPACAPEVIDYLYDETLPWQ